MKTNGIEIKKNLLLALFSVLFAASAILAVAFSLLPVTAHAAGEGMQVALSLQSDLVLKITAEETDSLTVYVRGKNNEELNKAELTEKNAAGQFEYHGVTPQLMSNTVVLQDNAGNEKEVSVKDYCTELLEGTAEGFGMSEIKFGALQTLAADILNYGAAAQAYMQSEYQSDDLANAGLTETQKDISARYEMQAVPETVKGSTGEATEGIYIRGAGVRFDNNAGIYFTVVAPAGTEGLGLEVELNGRSETLTAFTATEEENVYTVLYEDIYVAEYGLPVVGQLTRGGEKIGNEVTYSVNSYVASKADGNDAALSDLVKSLYVFNQSALVYENADPTPDDEGPLTSYRFEAESAKILDSSNGKDHFCTSSSLEFSPDFSGNLTLCNLGTAPLSFTFEADKAVRSTLQIRMANQYYSTTGGQLGKYVSITVNGQPAADMSIVFENTGEPASGSSSSYFNMTPVETKVSLVKGENVLEITPVTSNYLNLDYIEIQTSAELTNMTDSTLTDPGSFVNITADPGMSTEGTIGFDCDECNTVGSRERTLPALWHEIYQIHETGDGAEYSIEICGKEIVVAHVVRGDSYTLTVQGGKLENGSLSGEFPADSIVNLSCDSVPEGKTLVGWYNVDDRTEFYSMINEGSAIAMPSKDVTIAPLFDVETYFDSDTKVGKLLPDGGVYNGKEIGCYPVDVGITGAVRNADGEYELGNIYHFKGGTTDAPAEMAADSWFLTTAMNNWGSAGNIAEGRTVTTTIENFGDEDVTLRFALVTSSSNPNSQYGEATVTIKAGETVTFSFDVTYLHNSFMTNVMVKDHAVSEVYIGMFQYISNVAS